MSRLNETYTSIPSSQEHSLRSLATRPLAITTLLTFLSLVLLLAFTYFTNSTNHDHAIHQIPFAPPAPISPSLTFTTYTEQRIATTACPPSLTCQVLLFIEYVKPHFTIAAGYLIFSADPTQPEAPLSRQTQHNIATTSQQFAHSYATLLVHAMAARFPDRMCDVQVDQIADAIRMAAIAAAACPVTEDPRCFAFYKVRMCLDGER